MRRGTGWRIALVVALVFVVWMPAARAANDDEDEGVYSDKGMRAMFLVGAVYLLEPLIPDIRFEFGDTVDGVRAVFAWPVFVGHIKVAEKFALSPFVEPQWVRSTDESRLLIGTRASLFAGSSRGLVVEGAVRVRSEGNVGGTIGAGVMLWGRPPTGRTMPTISLVYRMSMAPDDEPLHDITLDVTTWSLLDLVR